jgi:DNA-binding NtrC family response regulator
MAQPLCAVDGERNIVFVNESAAAWLSVSEADLLGRQCRYRSGDFDPLVAAADALCPPPQVFQNQRASGIVVKPSTVGALERRNAEFIPLVAGGDVPTAVLIVLDAENLPAESAAMPDCRPTDQNADDESQRLHEIVGRFRRDLELWHHPSRLAGRNPAMQRVRGQIKLAAAGAGTVLIVGPPGIGRQHVARTIHAAAQSKEALTPIACASMPADLLRSTIDSLFSRRNTLASNPLNSILLLDADRLPVETQVELADRLSVARTNIRIMTTATERLDALAARGEFRGDLAQFLTTLVIELPPLASRPDDIPTLAQMFVEDLNAQGSRQLRGFTADAMDRLVEYSWPGQIDELAAVVRESALKADGIEIRASDLPKRLHHAAEAVRYARRPVEPIDLEKFLAGIERDLIERAMRESKGKKSQAARLLGLTRPRLYRRMVQLGLEPASQEDIEPLAE